MNQLGHPLRLQAVPMPLGIKAASFFVAVFEPFLGPNGNVFCV
jgi:hypothetical protein